MTEAGFEWEPPTRASRRHFVRTVYLQQCRLLAHLGLVGFASTGVALRAGRLDECWFAVHGMLSASARLSLMARPDIRKRARESDQRWRRRRARGRWLSGLLQIPSDSLIHSRGIRNSQEHLDERLDEFLWRSDGSSLFQSHVIQPDRAARMIMFRASGEPVDVRSDTFFWLDPEDMVVSFLDEQIALDALRHELSRIHDAADALFKSNFLQP